MRHLLAVVLLVFMAAAATADTAPACRRADGCRVEPGDTHDIGRGVRLTLPEGWTTYSYPQEPRDVMAGLRELRAYKGAMVIAISPFPNIDLRRLDDASLRSLHGRAAAAYLPHSREKAMRFVTISRGDLVGSYTSFTAAHAGEAPFSVLPDQQHASVTSFLISYRNVIFSISLASKQAPDDDYRAALEAIRSLQ